jgi:hypothetical protein
LIVGYQKTIGSLCASGNKGIGNQYVSQDKVIVDIPDEQTAYALRMRSGCNGGVKVH